MADVITIIHRSLHISLLQTNDADDGDDEL